MKKIFLITEIGKFQIALDKNASINSDIINALPIKGKAKTIEGEIFYLINLNIEFDGTEKEKFAIGDIVYWRSQKTEKFAIAVFYGNTKFDSFNSPTAASPAIKIGTINGSCETLKNITNDSEISINI